MTRLAAPTYQVIRSIDHHGVAEIDVCYHKVFGEEVVRKRFDTLGLEDSIAYREPQLLHGITHPNVAQIFDARLEQQDGIPVVEIYMPYYREGSINDALMADYSFSHRQAVELTRDVLSALTYVHEQMGYLHRDVKPANILLTDSGRRALLTDFGSAAVMDDRGLARGSLGRSPLYEPPEASGGDSGVPGDVYAVGLCLFEMLNGRFRCEDLDYKQVTERLREGRRALPDRMYEHGFWVPRRYAASSTRPSRDGQVSATRRRVPSGKLCWGHPLSTGDACRVLVQPVSGKASGWAAEDGAETTTGSRSRFRGTPCGQLPNGNRLMAHGDSSASARSSVKTRGLWPGCSRRFDNRLPSVFRSDAAGVDPKAPRR